MSDSNRRKRSAAELSHAIEGKYSPSEFMRARRPELFSDSKVRTEHILSQEVLDYRLSILTSKKQEIDFEHFCRRIAEREICPNLVSQTGPTGGGDSKVDSENYPVSERISMRWYQGLHGNSEEDRWAFAFSAKREWRSKVRADVKSIADTKRGYKIVYFITNQYVKDKSRAQVEDQLTGKYGIKVRILDRSWLLKCVFEHKLQDIAIETLHLDAQSGDSLIVGPKDLSRTEQLNAIEARINDTTRYCGVEYQLVEECLSAAILSRNLERPRNETEGRFSRAQRIAEDSGTPQQQLRIAYNRAWTAYWWFEDWNEYLHYYDLAEPLAIASDSIDDVELAVNLWQLLYGGCVAGKIDEVKSGLHERENRLRNALSNLSENRERPNTGLAARTHLALMDLSKAAKEESASVPIIKKLVKIVAECEGLIDYPVEPFAQIVDELGVVFSDVPQFDQLVEAIVQLTQERAGREAAGRMLLTRGYQKLRALAIYDAIRLFGRAQQKLAIREARDELAQALFAGGLAYQAAGLLWAARANTLSSANLVYAELREGGPIPHKLLLCTRKLIWQELQLGRVAHVLQWIDFASVLAVNQGLDPDEKEEFSSERESQDLTLALLLLKADLTNQIELRYLPDVLDDLELPYSRMALLYALGYEDVLRTEGSIPASETSEGVLSLFSEFVKHTATSDLPNQPTALGSEDLSFVSPVLGCRVIANPEADYESQRLAERILAGLEALLATSLGEKLFPYKEELVIEVRRSSSHQGPPRVVNDRSLEENVSVLHGGSISGLDSDWFLHILAITLPRLVLIDEPDDYLRRVFGEESGLARSLNFTESAITISNLLGQNPKTRIPDWNHYKEPRAFIPRRETTWHNGEFSKPEKVRSEPRIGTGEIPRELKDRNATKHTERRVSSLIDIPLWDKAKWRGVLYIWPEELDLEPFVALGFENGIAARAIFKTWRDKFGEIDKDERLRISIITGINRLEPTHYTVLIGSNALEPEDGGKAREIVFTNRIQTMTPANTTNLTTFLARFERVGTYQLMPALLDLKTHRYQPYPSLAIQKRQLRVAPAWKIEEHDPDSVGIRSGDDPVIPEDVQDAPVLKILKRRHKRSDKS